ncbi:hypothetical protein P691DRAFT_783283 [Macrolepiota fuliginosa MF-IS2]|uniref:Uncharacterized protein n=1 Tax=Macrolepiota fuliginosa MF-IS2 TaxID=1400762 RepID=A0A9P6C8A3_9AGAR|nr:hypothetical protein P691DRAFT_783283 [Macrolepiota fuliginosa MF-IS2]
MHDPGHLGSFDDGDTSCQEPTGDVIVSSIEIIVADLLFDRVLVSSTTALNAKKVLKDRKAGGKEPPTQQEKQPPASNKNSSQTSTNNPQLHATPTHIPTETPNHSTCHPKFQSRYWVLNFMKGSTTPLGQPAGLFRRRGGGSINRDEESEARHNCQVNWQIPEPYSPPEGEDRIGGPGKGKQLLRAGGNSLKPKALALVHIARHLHFRVQSQTAARNAQRRRSSNAPTHSTGSARLRTRREMMERQDNNCEWNVGGMGGVEYDHG